MASPHAMSASTNNGPATGQSTSHNVPSTLDSSPAHTLHGDGVDLEKQAPSGEAAHPVVEEKAKPSKDPNILTLDDLEDSINPMKWKKGYKWRITIVMALMTLAVTFTSSMFSTAAIVTAEEYGVSPEVTVLGISLFVLVSDSPHVTFELY